MSEKAQNNNLQDYQDFVSVANRRTTCEIKTDKLHRIIYATDASAYREMPYGVAFPQNVDDLQDLIAFAKEQKVSIIPRAAGTSLAGQVVGSGLVVDISKHLNKILEINEKEQDRKSVV